MLAFWWQRIEVLVQDSRTVIPISLRENPPDCRLPATVLSEYSDDESGLLVGKGEQVFVLGRMNRTVWRIQTTRQQQMLVPALYLVIRVPDLEAMNMSLTYVGGFSW